MADRRYALLGHSHAASGVAWGGITGTLADQTDLQSALDGKVDDAEIANVANWDTAFGWGDHASGGYAASSHTHVLTAGATDVTALAAEVNLLDLSGLTAGDVLSADTATTASWKAAAGGGGTQSILPIFPYEFDANTASSDPGAGKLRYNSATMSAVTAIYFNDSDSDTEDSHWILSNLSLGDLLTVGSGTDRPDYQVLKVTSAPTDNTGWWTVPVEVVYNGTNPTAADILTISPQWFSQVNGVLPVSTANYAMLVADGSGDWVETTRVKIIAGQLLAYSGINNISMKHDGFNGTLGTNLGGMILNPGNGVIKTTIGDEFRLIAGIGSDYMGFKHDGTDFISNANNTADWNITGMTGMIKSDHPLAIKEAAAEITSVAAYGQLWVKTATPCQLWFTDDAGTATQIV